MAEMSSLMVALYGWLSENWQGVVASAALTITLGEALLSRRHNRLSVTPHLDFRVHADEEEGTLSLCVQNNGLGPAMIVGVEVFCDGERVPGDDTEEALKVACDIAFPGKAYRALRVDGPVAGSSLAVGEMFDAIRVDFGPGATMGVADLRAIAKRIRLVLRYQSFYGERVEELDTARGGK